jgi:hypothetical protein
MHSPVTSLYLFEHSWWDYVSATKSVLHTVPRLDIGQSNLQNLVEDTGFHLMILSKHNHTNLANDTDLAMGKGNKFRVIYIKGQNSSHL